MESISKAENRLREAGIKVTGPRLAIYAYLLDTPAHPTCEQIYSALKDKNPTLSLASVYNVTEKLADEELLQSLIAPDGSRHYDGITDFHGHFFCMDCNRIIDIPYSNEDIHVGLTGSVISSVSLSLEGYCPDCVEKEFRE